MTRAFTRVNIPLLLVLLPVMFLLGKSCNQHKPFKPGFTDMVEIYHYDSAPRLVKGPASVVLVHDTFKMPGKIDTITVIQEFYTQKVFLRHYLDSETSIAQTYTIFKNQLLSGPLTYKILRPCKNLVITQNIEPKFSIGIGLTLCKTIGIGPQFTRFKNGKYYSASADLVNRNLVLGVGINY